MMKRKVEIGNGDSGVTLTVFIQMADRGWTGVVLTSPMSVGSWNWAHKTAHTFLFDLDDNEARKMVVR